jgi:enoyl-CoA hydratase/carnithine racemase
MAGPDHGVSIERLDRIAIVRLDGPTPGNLLSQAAMTALLEAARGLSTDPYLAAVVLTGRADLFTLGFNLADGDRMGALPLAERREALSVGPRLCGAFEALEPLTIMAVEGWCVGGGVAIAGGFDLRVAGAGARFYVPEIERGMNMSWGSLPRLVNLMGPARTKRLVMLAEKLDAPRAAEWGLVDELAPAGGALDRALAFAARAATMPPVQLRMCKAGINAYANALAPVAAALDRDQYLLAQASADYAEGVASFREKREPRYRGE